MKILVADDSKTNLDLIKLSLEKWGHEVFAASSAKEAIDIFQITRPDFIILDVVMKGMDGFECAKKIREISDQDWIPIIFLSGSVDDESIAKGIDAGGDDYLTKPFSEITLAAKIKAMQRIATMRNDLYEATQKLTVLSSTDMLTGAANRLMFNKIIREKIALSSRKNLKFALLNLDLDKFKSINDTLGHDAGDSLLIEVTKRLQACLRVEDFLARMGGDEFAIILSIILHDNEVDAVCKKIISVLSQPFNLNGHQVITSTSIGIVFYPEDGIEPQILSKNSDLAMYQAKKSGRNNYKYFKKSLIHSVAKKNLPPIPVVKKEFTVLHFRINHMLISIDINYLQLTTMLAQLEKIPNCAPFLVGLLNVAGESIPIIDLSVWVNLPRTMPYTTEHIILIARFNRHTFGFIVDEIVDLQLLTTAQLQKQNILDDSLLFAGSINTESGVSLLLNLEQITKKLVHVNESDLVQDAHGHR